jgi:hypothetical protein
MICVSSTRVAKLSVSSETSLKGVGIVRGWVIALPLDRCARRAHEITSVRALGARGLSRSRAPALEGRGRPLLPPAVSARSSRGSTGRSCLPRSSSTRASARSRRLAPSRERRTPSSKRTSACSRGELTGLELAHDAREPLHHLLERLGGRAPARHRAWGATGARSRVVAGLLGHLRGDCRIDATEVNDRQPLHRDAAARRPARARARRRSRRAVDADGSCGRPASRSTRGGGRLRRSR